MATETRVYRWTWSPTPSRLLAIASFVVFLLAALTFNGTITGWNGHVVLCIGLACLSGAFVF
jgi:peptidoglycan/LPS O-acetylase OafA/YrhL